MGFNIIIIKNITMLLFTQKKGKRMLTRKNLKELLKSSVC